MMNIHILRSLEIKKGLKQPREYSEKKNEYISVRTLRFVVL